MSHTVLGPREYRSEMRRVEWEQRDNPYLKGKVGPDRERWLRNALTSLKVYERPDYGPLADFRELLALRLAPWLRAQRRF